MHSDDNDATEAASDIEDGTYYQAARHWYSVLFHTPIAERSYYLVIILLATINGYFAITSFINIFPIKPRVPFITYSNDVYEDLPRMIRITADKGEDANIAVMKYYIRNYVINRESFDIPHYDMRNNNVWSQSADNVREQYRAIMDTSNPYSPYRLYTSKIRRDITLTSVSYERGPQMSQAHVVFEASVVSLADSEEINHTKWRADLTFNYSDFVVDQSLTESNRVAQFFGLTGNTVRASGEERKVIPMTFMVSGYQVKELLE